MPQGTTGVSVNETVANRMRRITKPRASALVPCHQLTVLISRNKPAAARVTVNTVFPQRQANNGNCVAMMTAAGISRTAIDPCQTSSELMGGPHPKHHRSNARLRRLAATAAPSATIRPAATSRSIATQGGERWTPAVTEPGDYLAATALGFPMAYRCFSPRINSCPFEMAGDAKANSPSGFS
jgi:hypothetical protein